MNEQSREATDIADELIHLVARRLAEGADSATVAAGLSRGLGLIQGLGPEAREIVETICRLLDEGRGPAVRKDQPR